MGDMKDAWYVRTVTCAVLIVSVVIGGFCSLFVEKLPEYTEKDTTEEK